jgi:RNA polymerase sigma-70 factor (ECF subfamily)
VASRWFAEEVHVHDRQLKAFLRGSFPSVRDVDDVVQESYLKVWKARAAQPIQSARAFLYRVARRVALDILRKERRSPIDAMSNFAEIDVLEDKASPAETLSLQEKVNALTDIVAGLPARRREIILLCKFERLSAQEAGRQLGLSKRTVENHLARGIRQCEARLRAIGIRDLYSDEKR